jgi:hypothetical protein
VKKRALSAQKEKEHEEERMALVRAMHRDFSPMTDIAKALGMSREGARQVLAVALDSYIASDEYKVTYMRAVDNLRLERCLQVGFSMLEALATKKDAYGTRTQVLQQIVKTMERRSRLMGLDSPAAPPSPPDDGKNHVIDLEEQQLVPKVLTE